MKISAVVIIPVLLTLAWNTVLLADSEEALNPDESQPLNYSSPTQGAPPAGQRSCLRVCLADGKDDYLCAENCVVVASTQR